MVIIIRSMEILMDVFWIVLIVLLPREARILFIECLYERCNNWSLKYFTILKRLTKFEVMFFKSIFYISITCLKTPTFRF